MDLKTLSIPDTYKVFSGSLLKVLALVCMTLDHTGAYLMHPADGLPLRLVGRLAFPIFAFLLAEGYSHSKDIGKYAGRLLAAAVISEVPFDLMMSGTVWDWNHQNVMWTLLLGLAAIHLWESFAGSKVIRVAGCLAVVSLGWVLNTDYYLWGAFLPLLFHLLRDHREAQLLAGAALSQNSFQAAAYIPIALYNGQRGFLRGKWKWTAYIYYPAHMLAIWAITRVFGLPA